VEGGRKTTDGWIDAVELGSAISLSWLGVVECITLCQREEATLVVPTMKPSMDWRESVPVAITWMGEESVPGQVVHLLGV
jgi:hypothetical protein